MINYVGVILSFATASEIDRLFTYKVPYELSEYIEVGQRVEVPFGRSQSKVGYVMEIYEEIEETSYRIKAIKRIIDFEPILTTEQIEIINFMAKYYLCSYAACIDTVVPAGLKDKQLAGNSRYYEVYKLNDDRAAVEIYKNKISKNKRTEGQQKLIEHFEKQTEEDVFSFRKTKEFSKSSLQTLLKNGVIVKEVRERYHTMPVINYDKFKKLNDEQQDAVEYLSADRGYETILLQGVTGSGKTEVFLYAIKDVLEKGGTAIVLVPEIALTMQTLQRFQERFGDRVVLTHSRMTPKQRQDLYIKAKNNEVDIIIGPRSAVFMPLSNLKLIVIDEAHDTSYKADTGTPKYHAADIAKKRMELNKGKVLLATATPSMEDYYNAKIGKYAYLRLNERVTGTIPDVEIVDMRLEFANKNKNILSRSLEASIEDALSRNKQVMLLINRRGYSTFISCRSCGYVVKCPHCDVSLTYHLDTKEVSCHYCGYKTKVPTECPECKSKYIRYMGTGTQKLEEYIKERFSGYNIDRMDADTTSGKDGHDKILTKFRNKETDILIGTQMIAKGHDFPEVVLVGIISADNTLFKEDFRSSERTYQLLTQALGRAGRAKDKGKVVIQTYNPEHIVMQRIKHGEDYRFYEDELNARTVMNYPPFSNIFTVVTVGKNEEETMRTISMIAAYFKHYSDKGQNKFRVLGPTPCIIGKIGDEYRYRLLVIGEKRDKLLIYGKYCLSKFFDAESKVNVKVQWDINPLSLM